MLDLCMCTAFDWSEIDLYNSSQLLASNLKVAEFLHVCCASATVRPWHMYYSNCLSALESCHICHSLA